MDLYAQAGVNIDAAQDLLGAVKGKIEATRRPEVLRGVGGFGGLFQLDLTRWKEPILVSSVDGVGTKLMVANMVGKHDTVGRDLVNHCINDIAVQGAEPLYFLDYLGIGRLRSPLFEEVLTGLADACAEQNVALLGGETAEMPGMYGEDYDLVGCIVGAVERSQIITGDNIEPGDVIIGLPSSGLHTNGYSLARKILFEQCGYTVETELEELGTTVGDALLKPHVCYWPAIKAAITAGIPLRGIAHLTGGGFYDNIPRVLPAGRQAVIDRGALSPAPPIFDLIQRGGNVPNREMYRVFNMGTGMVWVVPGGAASEALACCREQGFDAVMIGRIEAGDTMVQLND
ncbi:MAG: phosphoribosylformylglycinamidine cyclo-ligase [Rhodothermales bacterium]|jgi:phosphoribosylformylglycinamidine cyclo-ligase